jgi:hypothetical protein
MMTDSAPEAHIAVFLARAIGIAIDHVADQAGVQAGMTGHQGANRDRGEIVGADPAQATSVLAEWRAHGIDKVGVLDRVHMSLS